MKKRLLSLLLVLSMCMSMCVICAGTASAATGTAAEGYYLATETLYENYSDGESWYYITTYTYDSNGNLLTRVSENNEPGSSSAASSYTYTYDTNGNVLTMVVESVSSGGYISTSSTTNYTYDSNGNVLTESSISDYNYGGYCSTGYDTTTYTYDDNGNLLTKVEVNASGETHTYTYTYDDNGNVLTKDYKTSGWGTTYTYTYTYDNNGNVLTETYENNEGSTVTYDYTYTYDDNGNLLKEVCESSNSKYSYTHTYTYDNSGNLLAEAYEGGSGYTYAYTYDSNGNVLTHSYRYTSTSSFWTYTYTYDSNNNLIQEARTCIESDGSESESCYTYTYDSNGNMLSSVSSNGTTYTYTYDSYGNLLSKEYVSSDGDTRTYVYTYISLAELQGNTEEEEVENPFTDVQNTTSWYYNAVMWAVEKGITNGTTDTTFSPTQDCTRAEIVTFLWRAAGCPEPETTENPFTDVESGKYYYKAVLWAVEEGITTGTSSTTFSPNASCTRAEAVTFIYRYAKSPSVSATDKFTDVSSSKWYTSAVAWAVENSITSGTSSTTFSPNTTCSRAMIVTFLYRYCA